MNNELINSVAAGWARLGVMVNVAPAAQTPDLEGLLLDTARVAASNTKLFTLGATWLARNGEYVARHALANRIERELESNDQATLGFMLEWAESNGKLKRHFLKPISACRPAAEARPLSDVENGDPHFATLAKERASALSRKWGRWMEDFEARDDALRAAEWIASNNPSLSDRAMVGGDLVATVLDSLKRRGGRIASEAELARECGATRAAVRDAIRRLRLANRITCKQQDRSNVIELVQRSAS